MNYSMPGMEHGGEHSGHTMPGSHACKMNMLWNTDPTDICIIFPSWQVTTRSSLVASLLFIVALAASYEGLRLALRRLDARLAIAHGLVATPGAGVHRRRASVLPSNLSGMASLGHGRTASRDEASSLNGTVSGRAALPRRRGLLPYLPIPRGAQVARSLLYGLSVALSMFLMLIFMTYNSHLIIAVLVGAMVGHYSFNRDIGQEPDKSLACH